MKILLLFSIAAFLTAHQKLTERERSPMYLSEDGSLNPLDKPLVPQLDGDHVQFVINQDSADGIRREYGGGRISVCHSLSLRPQTDLRRPGATTDVRRSAVLFASENRLHDPQKPLFRVTRVAAEVVLFALLIA